MHRSISKLIFAAPVMAAAMFMAAPGAHAQKTEIIDGGGTAITVSSTFTASLTGVTVGTLGPAEMRHGKIHIPVTGGAIDLDTALGEVQHAGGLTFTAGKTEVNLLDLVVEDNAGSPVITGLLVVNGALSGRIAVFDLTSPAFSLPVVPEHSTVTIDDVAVALDPAAAAALNGAFPGSTLTGGSAVGTLDITVVLPWYHGKRK